MDFFKRKKKKGAKPKMAVPVPMPQRSKPAPVAERLTGWGSEPVGVLSQTESLKTEDEYNFPYTSFGLGILDTLPVNDTAPTGDSPSFSGFGGGEFGGGGASGGWDSASSDLGSSFDSSQ